MKKAFIFVSLLMMSGIAAADDQGAYHDGESTPAFDLQIQNFGSRTYYDWGRARNGYGYCYEWTNDGQVLNGGQPQSNFYCEERRPSFYDWGRAQNGYGYCYQYTPYGVPMNEGNPQSNFYCEQRNPSFYDWGRGQDGKTYCYQYTSKGIPMNEGRPQSEFYCRR